MSTGTRSAAPYLLKLDAWNAVAQRTHTRDEPDGVPLL
jgi:hypothetical protein